MILAFKAVLTSVWQASVAINIKIILSLKENSVILFFKVVLRSVRQSSVAIII